MMIFCHRHQARDKESRWSSFFARVKDILRRNQNAGDVVIQKFNDDDKKLLEILSSCETQVHRCFCNNFDTAGVIRALDDLLITPINTYIAKSESSSSGAEVMMTKNTFCFFSFLAFETCIASSCRFMSDKDFNNFRFK
jgi:cysteinyl-tRNA synthetase